MITIDRLLDIAKRVSLLTNEGDDRMYGAYVDYGNTGDIKAKSSTLALIEDARQALKDAGVAE